MLNALRQSEENHDLHIAPASEAVSCSTPYGNQRKITGSTAVFDGAHIDVLNALRQSEENHTTGKGQAVEKSSVLNALRQSEENHVTFSASFCEDFALCSTPYGNQRKITAHPRILTLQGSDGAFASMYPYSIHQLPARRQVS